MGLDVLERPDVADPELADDEPRFAHYVDKTKMGDAVVYGTALVALCGYTWVPSRDPKKYPVCPECKEIYDAKPDDA